MESAALPRSRRPDPGFSGTGSGVLVVRAWIEPGRSPQLLARLLTADVETAPATTWATASGADAVCEHVRRWLELLEKGSLRS